MVEECVIVEGEVVVSVPVEFIIIVVAGEVMEIVLVKLVIVAEVDFGVYGTQGW